MPAIHEERAQSVAQPLAWKGHANHRVHEALGSVEQRITASSESRQQPVERLAGNAGGKLNTARALEKLRDEDKTALPIYRCALSDQNNENTLSTAVFTLTATAVEWRVYTRHGTQVPHAEGVVSVSK